METLEALSRRIGTTRDLQSVVRTMKSLAWLGIRRFERAERAVGIYARTIELGLQAVVQAGEIAGTPTSRPDHRPACMVVFGSDHGLCGRFNDMIAQFASERCRIHQHEHGPIIILAVGERVATRLEALGHPPNLVLSSPETVTAITERTGSILLQIETWRAERDVERVVLFNNGRPHKLLTEPEETVLLPIDPDWLRSLTDVSWPSRSLPLYTMDHDALFAALLRQQLFVVIYRALARSLASEHAMRLASMQSAETNIRDHLEEMDGLYRRLRQDSITMELLDATAGYEAMRTRGG
jgi:F-type H+-transporting ATPase subunit gamma